MATTGSWHSFVEREGEWPRLPWWRIDIRSDSRPADVKWVWELGRIRHVVLLARAAHLNAGDDDALDTLVGVIRSWLDENPPEVGIHWYSNLEIAIRGFGWLQILGLVGERLPADVRDGLTAQLVQSGRHLLRDLPYTVSSMRNNHLLGDALGLLMFGEAVQGYREARLWRWLGARLFDRQLDRQVRADGSMIEDSLSYHRFVVEMLAVRVLLDGDEETRQRLHNAAQFLVRLGVGSGPVPQYGDWDEGRVLATSQDPKKLEGSVALALALCGTGSDRRDEFDECAWYVDDGEPAKPEPVEVDGHDVGGGIARAQRGDITVWLKAGSGPSHGHADLCSTPVLVGGEWLVGDPGTGTYNGPIDVRNYFRSSIAHSVLRLDGHDQLEPHRAFRWVHKATGVIGPPLHVADAVVMWGAHDAYTRLRPRRRVARVVIVRDDQVVIADWVEGPGGARYHLSAPLPPAAHWDDGTVVLPSGARWNLGLPGDVVATTGRDQPFDGWWSHTYGSWEPATRLEATGLIDGPVVWQARRAGAPGGATVAGNRVGFNGHVVEVTWTPDGAALHVSSDAGEQVAILRLL